MTGTEPHTGVILASGRGSRLAPVTDDRPKCLIEFGGRPLLHWQTEALRHAGVDRVVVTTGYRQDQIERLGVETVHNPDWADTNMVGSLLCAMEALTPPFIVSYSDIVYTPSHVVRLLACPDDLAITYDTDWLDLWQRRFEDPLSDAQSFAVDNENWVEAIGGLPNGIDTIQGQFMGLLKISPVAAHWIARLIAQEPKLRRTLDTTSLLQRLIERNHRVRGVPVAGDWCEIDDRYDLRVAEGLLAEGRICLRT